jgi:hypothetical protein
MYQIGLAAAALAASLATSANAASINSVAAGSVSVVGAPCCQDGQVFSNIILDAANNRSNYLVFDVSSLNTQLAGRDAASATLTINGAASGFYSSADSTETFTLWNFTGNRTALAGYNFSNHPNATDAETIRQDLRSGTSYGSAVISKPANGKLPDITITLNAEGIAALNAAMDSADMLFVLGGFSDTLTGSQLLFQSSTGGNAIASLDVSAVPLPGAIWLFGTVLLGLGAKQWRKRTAAAAVA